ncbi:MAG: aminotransferase class IV, partial [Hyphomicrobium sp.]|nr:aminotransferase class IV [Hyphomicrobium sp.]
MTRIVYVNGRYLPYAEAAIHPEDRGNQFGDAVYEVCEVREGRLTDETRHLARLERSLGELGIPAPMSRAAWGRVLRETIRRNRVRNGLVYLQVSRGVARRDFFFPAPDTLPTVICLARRLSSTKAESQATKGIAIQSTPDVRWGRCDIKTVMEVIVASEFDGEGRHRHDPRIRVRDFRFLVFQQRWAGELRVRTLPSGRPSLKLKHHQVAEASPTAPLRRES